MKKVVLAVTVMVAFAFAFSVYAAEVKVKETVKSTPTETTTVVKEKAKDVKTTETIVDKGKEIDVTEVDKYKKSPVVKETIKFSKIEENGDYIYLYKDNKVIRLKHKLSDSVKKDMLKKKDGEQITVTSTYPLTNDKLAVIIDAK